MVPVHHIVFGGNMGNIPRITFGNTMPRPSPLWTSRRSRTIYFCREKELARLWKRWGAPLAVVLLLMIHSRMIGCVYARLKFQLRLELPFIF